MVERICPECQEGNALENRFCRRCGANLQPHAIVPRRERTALTPFEPQSLKRVGQTVAVSLMALAAEAGLSWLRRRLEAGSTPSLPVKRPSAQASPPSTALAPGQPSRRVVSSFSQRVTAVWEGGRLSRRTVERTVWREEFD